MVIERIYIYIYIYILERDHFFMISKHCLQMIIAISYLKPEKKREKD